MKTILLMAMLVFAWTAMAEEAAKPEMVATQTVSVKTGEQFTVSLESNPTTGYSWQLAKLVDEKVVQFVSSKYERTGKKGLVGAGGQEHWTFRSTGTGKTSVEMKYVRPWEKNVPPVRVATIVVEVK
jgi:inhibitor of cysteine peptidase